MASDSPLHLLIDVSMIRNNAQTLKKKKQKKKLSKLINCSSRSINYNVITINSLIILCRTTFKEKLHFSIFA